MTDTINDLPPTDGFRPMMRSHILNEFLDKEECFHKIGDTLEKHSTFKLNDYNFDNSVLAINNEIQEDGDAIRCYYAILERPDISVQRFKYQLKEGTTFDFRIARDRDIKEIVYKMLGKSNLDEKLIIEDEQTQTDIGMILRMININLPSIIANYLKSQTLPPVVDDLYQITLKPKSSKEWLQEMKYRRYFDIASLLNPESHLEIYITKEIWGEISSEFESMPEGAVLPYLDILILRDLSTEELQDIIRVDSEFEYTYKRKRKTQTISGYEGYQTGNYAIKFLKPGVEGVDWIPLYPDMLPNIIPT